VEKKKPSGRRIVIITTMVFAVVVTTTIIVSMYFLVWRDLWRPIVTVNDETVNMDYVIRRMKYVDKTDDILNFVYEVIPHEMLIRQGAPRYGIEVTPDEVDELLRDIARGENETISEAEFKEWYRNRLNETKLSDTEYREYVRTYMLAERLHEYLSERISMVAEQVHLYIIILPSYDDAETVITRIEDGEDFSKIAEEMSLDEESGGKGGDLGWWPKGAGLNSNLEWWAFNLEIGEVSNTPIPIDEEGQMYAVCMVTERQPARELDQDKLEVLKSGILEEWLHTERVNNRVVFGGMDWSEQAQRYTFGSETLAWLGLQLAKE